MKQCRHCCLEIHDDARLCPNCHGYQAWIANQRDPRVAVAVAVPVVLIMVAFLVFALRTVRPNTPLPVESFAATITQVTYGVSADGNRIFVLGSITNGTETTSGVWLRLGLLDPQGKVLDAPLVSPLGLVVPAHATREFRITSLISPAAANAARVTVTVVRAKSVSNWD